MSQLLFLGLFTFGRTIIEVRGGARLAAPYVREMKSQERERRKHQCEAIRLLFGTDS